MQQLAFKQGEIIFKEGDVSDVAYLLTSGKVEIFKAYGKGTVLLATMESGEIFGEMGIITEEPRGATAMASSDVSLRVVTRQEMNQLIQGQPDGVGMLIRALIKRLREANHMLTTLVNKQTDFEFQYLDGPTAVNKVTLIPGSDVLRKQMSSHGMILTKLPFRVGMLPPGVDPAMVGDLNDFYVKDGDAAHMARNHFSIQRTDKGLCVLDRGSKTGTLVNRKKIGGGIKLVKEDLHTGENEIIAGEAQSPYKFIVKWE